MRVQIKSIFEQIAEQVFKMTDATKAKTFITEFVNEKNINDDDKRTILNNIENLKSIAQIQRYICNSLLQYEGLGVGARKDPNE
jgi:ribosome biogenesis protein Nip4